MPERSHLVSPDRHCPNCGAMWRPPKRLRFRLLTLLILTAALAIAARVAVDIRDACLPVGPCYILGEVNRPGRFEIRGYKTVAGMILLAGGTNRKADRARVRLVSRTGGTNPRLFTRVVDIDDPTKDHYIGPGDRLFVLPPGARPVPAPKVPSAR